MKNKTKLKRLLILVFVFMIAANVGLSDNEKLKKETDERISEELSSKFISILQDSYFWADKGVFDPQYNSLLKSFAYKDGLILERSIKSNMVIMDLVRFHAYQLSSTLDRLEVYKKFFGYFASINDSRNLVEEDYSTGGTNWITYHLTLFMRDIKLGSFSQIPNAPAVLPNSCVDDLDEELTFKAKRLYFEYALRKIEMIESKDFKYITDLLKIQCWKDIFDVKQDYNKNHKKNIDSFFDEILIVTAYLEVIKSLDNNYENRFIDKFFRYLTRGLDVRLDDIVEYYQKQVAWIKNSEKVNLEKKKIQSISLDTIKMYLSKLDESFEKYLNNNNKKVKGADLENIISVVADNYYFSRERYDIFYYPISFNYFIQNIADFYLPTQGEYSSFHQGSYIRFLKKQVYDGYVTNNSSLSELNIFGAIRLNYSAALIHTSNFCIYENEIDSQGNELCYPATYYQLRLGSKIDWSSVHETPSFLELMVPDYLNANFIEIVFYAEDSRNNADVKDYLENSFSFGLELGWNITGSLEFNFGRQIFIRSKNSDKNTKSDTEVSYITLAVPINDIVTQYLN